MQQQQIHQQRACGYDELPPADPLILDLIAQETRKIVNIDGVPREIRFYGDTAVVMLAWDDPREIGFHGGARTVIFDNRESVFCSLNNTSTECIIEGSTHRLVINIFVVTFIKVIIIIIIIIIIKQILTWYIEGVAKCLYSSKYETV
jgi:hypothetical protein